MRAGWGQLRFRAPIWKKRAFPESSHAEISMYTKNAAASAVKGVRWVKKALRTGILVICLLLLAYWRFFVSMDFLPRGERILVSESPGGNQIHLYLCNGGATTSYAIRGEAVTDRGVKNIYWQYDETRADVRWLSDEVASINGVVLNIYEDVYDYRRNSR